MSETAPAAEVDSPGPVIEVGRPGRWFEFTVDADAAAAFASATNDPNPECLSGDLVPPMFTAGLILQALWAGHGSIPPGAIRGGTAGVHAQHLVTFHSPIDIGAALKVRSSLEFVKQVKPGAMSAFRIDVCDRDEKLLRCHHWINIDLGGVLVSDPSGEPIADPVLAEDMRDRPLGTHSVRVDRDQTYRYAGATGEFPPHSLTDSGARREGFTRKILQGMCTFGLGVSGVLAAAGADPRRLRSLAARFSRPCHPGSTLEIDMFDAGPHGGLSRRIGWEAMSEGQAVIRNGLVELDD